MNPFAMFTAEALSYLASLFIFVIGAGVLVIAAMFIRDVTQTRDAVRRNFPVIGRFRSFFSNLGEFFRQYFFAQDREELPFNRAERDWVEKSSRGSDNTVAFGSTRSLSPVGTVIFVNCAFPTLEEDSTPVPSVLVGPYCREPYSFSSLINISGMSYGALSKPAIRALSYGAKAANCYLNTGEGGLSPHHLEGGADIVFQIGTAKYGVRTDDGRIDDSKLAEVAALKQVRMFELKLAQGAKPGKGGILPAVKVTKEIAKIRGIEPFTDSISPNRHVEASNVAELLDFMDHIRKVTGKPVGFKTVIGAYDWLDTLCETIHARGIESAPDFISIDSGDGGTGAAPLPLMDNVGLTVREALPVVVDLITAHNLRNRIKIFCSGKLITPADVGWAYCAGADSVSSARGFMFALGCIQSLKCNKNTCPTGITTHDPRLQRGLDPAIKSVRVRNYVDKMHKDLNIIAHSCGVPHPRALRRNHCRIVQSNSRSIPLNELFPMPQIGSERAPMRSVQ